MLYLSISSLFIYLIKKYFAFIEMRINIKNIGVLLVNKDTSLLVGHRGPVDASFNSSRGRWFKSQAGMPSFLFFWWLMAFEKRNNTKKCRGKGPSLKEVKFWTNLKKFQEQDLPIKLPFIPLRAKWVGEFIEIRHKKISPTCILSTLGCLWLCNSVTLSLCGK